MKFYIQLALSFTLWFLLFYGVEVIFESEFMKEAKYWLTAIAISFFLGCHTGIYLLKKAILGDKNGYRTNQKKRA